MELSISRAREMYRPVAMRCSLIYFLIDSLSALDRVYYYSMANFKFVMVKGMVRIKHDEPRPRNSCYRLNLTIQNFPCHSLQDQTPGGRDESRVQEDQRMGLELELTERIQLLIDTTTHQLFCYVSQASKRLLHIKYIVFFLTFYIQLFIRRGCSSDISC